jgi:hypothetical protein
METRPDRRFYENRARAEREMARTARGPILTSIHSQLADIYQGLANGLYLETEVHDHPVVTSRPVLREPREATIH